jgi:hypothetical protein
MSESAKTDRRKVHFRCGEGGWALCTACKGRLHLPDCTSRMDRMKDCCPARHKMLHDQGHIRGLDDSSVVMWSPTDPQP